MNQIEQLLVVKRSGELVEFDSVRILNAINAAINAGSEEESSKVDTQDIPKEDENTGENNILDESINVNSDLGAAETFVNSEESLVLNDPIEEEKNLSNGLENFGIEEETPDLFEENLIVENSHEENTENKDVQIDSEEDEYEIPAFLRRQKN